MSTLADLAAPTALDMSFSLIGDGLQDAYNPKLRER